MKLGHLLTPVGILQQLTNVRPRLLSQIVEEVCAPLPEHLRTFMEENRVLAGQWEEGVEYRFPQLAVCPHVGNWQEGQGYLLSFTTPQLDVFEELEKRQLISCV